MSITGSASSAQSSPWTIIFAPFSSFMMVSASDVFEDDSAVAQTILTVNS